jgi:hypothetical protein
VIDLAPGSDSSPEAQLLASLGDRLVFSLQGGGLWATDGTAAGTHEILDRAPDFPADQWTVFGGRLWFLFQEGYLWTSDGTAAGTAQLLDRDGNPIYLPYRFAAVGDRLVVMAQGPFGLMLFESDGTPAGTFAVEPRVAPGAFDLTAAGGRAFFAGYDPATGWELWAVRP